MTIASVVTPTQPHREQLLVERCIRSVQALDWQAVEHVIVSDPNPGLADRLASLPKRDGYTIQFAEIDNSWRTPAWLRCTGSYPWGVGSRMALGEYVAFLGDDDELLPQHITRAVEAMTRTGADFTVSQVAFYADNNFHFIIGDDAFAFGQLDATGIVCRRSALSVACWDLASPDEEFANAGDYRMVRDWIKGGLKGAHVPEVTGNHHDGWLK